ncbi:MAG: sugar phosphate isomerase/epimerase, partial [Candidatus Omnitrophota bacterium]
INDIKSFVKNNRLPLRLHAPISEIDYSQVRDSASYMKSLYRKVIRFCKVLNINHVVTHAELDYHTAFPIDRQFENASLLWRALCDEFKINNIHINIENHCEIEPDYLVMFMERIGSPYLGMCIDIGHFNAFSNLGIKKCLEKYPVGSIKEVHLADNKGDGDTHLPLGDGNIDFVSFFETFSGRRERCVFVLEPREIKEAQKSLSYLRKKGLLVE